VARLAGLPDAVISRAEDVLKTLETGEQSGAGAKLADDLPLFAVAPPHQPSATPIGPSPVEETLAEISPDDLTPREALEELYRLKRIADENE